MDTLLQDIRHAVRQLSQRPAFTAVVVITLALGIGANSAIFTVVNSVLLRPLTYPDPERLVLVWERNQARQQSTNVVNPGNYLDWRDRARSFTDLAAFGWASLTFTGGAPEVVPGRMVTANFFKVLGTAPAMGRSFTTEEALPNGPPVIVLSDGLWRRRFGGDAGVVGRAVPVAGGSATVLGVMPPGFRPMPWGHEEYWEPFRYDPADRSRNGRYLMVIGRLKPGLSELQAQADMDAITHGLEREYPDFDTGWGANVVSMSDQVVGGARRGLLVALGAVGIVLLIACANVGNLMLVRADSRRREFAVRAALGASRGRLIRQWLAEGVVLASVGGASGLVLATWAVDLLRASGPADIPRLAELAVDGRVVAVTAVLTVLTGIVTGLPAALQGSFGRALTSGGERTTAAAGTTRFRSMLAVVQLALTLVLLAGAGLLLRSLHRLTAVDPGFDPSRLLTFSIDLPAATYPDGARQSAFFDHLLDRVRALPAVSGAGGVSFLPLTGSGAATRFTIVGRPAPEPGHWTSADIRVVDTGYFHVMRIPLLSGRGFTAGDRRGAPPVVIIDQTMARQFWPGADPVGARLQINWWHAEETPEVVGIVGDVHAHTLDGSHQPMIYYPQALEPSRSLMIVARYSGTTAALSPAVRAAVHGLDQDVAVSDVATMDSRVVESTSDRRYPLLVLGAFAALAVLLAAVGVYGVLAYGVTLRLREFGVRIALGAGTADLMRMVLGSGLRLALIGVSIGAAGALLSTRVLSRFLYDVTPTDPLTFLAVASLLVFVALAAVAAPARRAARTDPMTVLRSE